jgi:hypothetical protein
MKCPNCKAEITRVNVYSQCIQQADVDENGKIEFYDSVDEILETLDIECRECAKSIKDIIQE